MRDAHAVTEEPVPARFLRDAAHGVADIEPEDLQPGNLTLRFGVSAWIKGSDLDLARATAGLLRLRSAILSAAGMHRGSEPVPLLAGDGPTALLNLVVYLHGLLQRGARTAGTSRRRLADDALALLGV